MKITQKHIQYILLLLIVAIAFSAYYFGYLGYIDKANKIRQSNKTIEARIGELTEKESHRDEWNEGIVSSDKAIKETLAKYGPGNTPEKSIMFIKGLEEETGMYVPSIAFSNDSVIYSSNEVDENGNPILEMSSSLLTINYSATYDGLKQVMDYINNYTERMNVSGFSASYNQENGQLAGNMVINLFGVKDKDHQYTDPVIYGVETGIDNIFGTIELPEENNITGNSESATAQNNQPETTENENSESGSNENNTENQ